MSEKVPGFEEYTPSRIEWLVVMLNSYVQYINSTVGDHFNYVYVTGDDGKTIELMISHPNDVSPERLKNAENLGKEFAIDIAKKYKWDSWLEIETHFSPMEEE